LSLPSRTIPTASCQPALQVAPAANRTKRAHSLTPSVCMSTRCVAFAPRSVKLRGCLSAVVRHSLLTRTCRQPPTAANPARRVTTAAMSQGGANNGTAGGSGHRSSGGEPCFQRDDATGTFRLTMAVGAGSRAAVRSTNFHSTLSLAVTAAAVIARWHMQSLPLRARTTRAHRMHAPSAHSHIQPP
jgi:hypothetical protein